MKDLVDTAYEDAHRDYEKRKAEVISRLNTICDVYGTMISPTVIKWLKQTIEFIKEKEF